MTPDELPADMEARTPAPEGEAATLCRLCLMGFKEHDCIPEPLYASLVVPVGVEEVARIIFDATYDARHGSTSEMEAFWSRCDEAADAILAALRPTDTGRE